jgi:hypothetical protein
MTDIKCKSIEDQLKDVLKQLSHFDALKLSEQKAELEASAKKKQTAVAEYEKKYPELLNEWRRQDIEVEQLRQSIQCVFEHDGGWKKHAECACAALGQIHALESSVKKLKGERENKRDDAKFAMEKAKKDLAGWEGAAAGIDTRLKENDKLIKEIRALAGPDQIHAVYKLWFKLMPSHSELRPLDRDHSWEGESVLELCKECEEDSTERWPRTAPWLTKPAGYPETIDCASDNYRTRKAKYADSESAFQSDPDDVISLTKKIEEKYKSKDDDVKKCMDEKKPAETTAKTTP